MKLGYPIFMILVFKLVDTPYTIWESMMCLLTLAKVVGARTLNPITGTICWW